MDRRLGTGIAIVESLRARKPKEAGVYHPLFGLHPKRIKGHQPSKGPQEPYLAGTGQPLMAGGSCFISHGRLLRKSWLRE